MLPIHRATLVVVALLVAPACGGGAAETREQQTEGSPQEATAPDQVAKAVPGELDFADESFLPASRDSATYRIERVFVEAVMMVEGVPTYADGMALKASQTPLARYTFNYYRLDDDSLAFSVETTVLRDDATQYIHSGTGIWYDRDLVPTARGAFDGGQLHGEYQELDSDGNVKSTVLYDRGEPYDPRRFAGAVHRPLLGTWVSTSEKGSMVERLVNVYDDAGEITIQKIVLSKNSVLGGADGLRERSRSDPTTWSWKYTSRDRGSGDVEYYDGTKLMGRSRLTFSGPDAFEARVTYHTAPSLVGARYQFQRSE